MEGGQEADYDSEKDPGLEAIVYGFIKDQNLRGLDLNAFWYLLNVNIEHEWSGPIDDLSLWFDEGSEFPGGDVLVLGGYKNVLKPLKDVDVRLQHQVTEVDYSSSKGVKVTAKTPDGKKSFEAAMVIVTLPLGVMKSSSVKFKPGLPTKNRKAISSLGFGLLDKCVLVFEKSFWGSREEFIERIDPTGKGAWQETLSLIPYGDLPVLYAFNAAKFAELLEDKTDSEVVANAMAFLREIWPDASDPYHAYISRWGKDPFARGAYSYATPRMEPRKARKDAAKPVGKGRVRFAGEHTSLQFPATVHGAYKSGIQTACSVLKTFKKNC